MLLYLQQNRYNNLSTTPFVQQEMHNTYTSTDLQPIYSSKCTPNVVQQHTYNNSFATTYRLQTIQQHTYNTHIQQQLDNNIYTPTSIHHHLYNNIYTTPYVQQRIYNNTSTIPYLQQPIYNTMHATPDIQHHRQRRLHINMYTTTSI